MTPPTRFPQKTQQITPLRHELEDRISYFEGERIHPQAAAENHMEFGTMRAFFQDSNTCYILFDGYQRKNLSEIHHSSKIPLPNSQTQRGSQARRSTRGLPESRRLSGAGSWPSAARRHLWWSREARTSSRQSRRRRLHTRALNAASVRRTRAAATSPARRVRVRICTFGLVKHAKDNT